MTAEKAPATSSQGPPTPALAPSSRYCKATTRAGLPCRAYPRPSTGLCFCHDPACRDHVRAAGRKGAAESHRRRALADTTVVQQLESPEDVRRLLSETVHQLRIGVLDRATANGIAYGCQVALRAIDVRDLQRRIESLEAAAKKAGK